MENQNEILSINNKSGEIMEILKDTIRENPETVAIAAIALGAMVAVTQISNSKTRGTTNV